MSTPPDQQPEGNTRINWWQVLGLGVLLLVGIIILLPAIQQSRQAARLANCIGTLKFHGFAMHNYHDQHRCFPPAYFADKSGRPMHSWRVLVLPHMEAHQLYEEYYFDGPWNDPDNLALARNVPSGMLAFNSTYRCPSETEADKMHATYLMLVGTGAFSDGPHSRTIDEITDGTHCTIMTAERSRSGIHWMEPRDLDVAKMSYTINDPAGYGIRSPHPGVANAIFGDGSVSSISENIDPEIVKAIITIDAGDRGSEFHTVNEPW